ncbi:FitA-like ribbon-helix-helix domain-containing protein [Endozoicomonas sp. ALD040]|uniref:FitA-like ribbon-helix-helix domain-containing protein n=1 Tax=unclassified Endozoicomonas TaxID=2644528 RepID=UPI003BAF3749
MATLTIRNLPDELVERLKLKAKAANRSMEQELRELLEASYPRKQDTIDRIRSRWNQLPETHHEEMDEWRNEGRP